MATTMKSTRSKYGKKKLAEKSMDEFMASTMDTDTDDQQEHTTSKSEKKRNKSKKNKNTAAVSPASAKKMKKSLEEELKDTDPEFYKFLQDEDKELLDFEEEDDEDETGQDVSDGDGDVLPEDPGKKRKEQQKAAAKKAFEKEILNMSSGSDDSEEEEDDAQGVFQPPTKLEVASDDEEYEDRSDDADEDSDDDRRKVKKDTKLITAAMVKAWTKQLQGSPSVDVLREVVSALAAAAQQAGIAEDVSTKYRVEGSTDFNSIMRMCLAEVVPALESLLTLKSISNQQQLFSQKNKKWKSVKGTVKTYCTLMLQLSGELSEASMINVILRHVHKLVVCYAAFPKLAKVFLKKLVSLWSGGEETTRVLAFLSINKLVRLQADTMLEPTLKQMHMAYISNCRFVSPNTLPLINFMQRSMVEVFLIQEDLAYQHAFLYIRQLAIHLRNAITTNKKEMCQTVYNWQFILSLGLWSQLLGTSHPSPTLQPLIYPLIQVIIGTIRLLPTARYYPLRFHCVRYLTQLSGATNTFVPVVPFLLEVLEQTNFNKKLKASSIKTLSLNTILKFSKPQLQENMFKDAVVDQLCELLLDYLCVQSHTAAFPELIVPLVVQLKDFLKKCKVAALCKQVKQVLEKAEETARVVEARRRSTTFNLADAKAVELWETKNKEEGTPLSKFYVSWRKLRDRQLQKDIAGKDQITTAAEKIPKIVLPKGPRKATDAEREELAGLFGNDDDENDGDTVRFLPKDERIKKLHGTELESDEEDYSDFDSDDLEQLAKSASEEEDNSSDDDDDADDDSDEEKGKNAGQGSKRKTDTKRKQPTSATSSAEKKRKMDVKDDSGDVVEDFVMSDFDSESD